MEEVIGLKLPDGGIYSGDVNDNGQPHSTDGTCTWGNTAYVGCWIDGKMSGLGSFYESGQIKYRGFWWEGELIHIFGTEELPRPETKLPKNKNKIAALLVGNNYVGTSSELPKCTADVDAIGHRLANIGVDVTLLKNADRTRICQAIEEICKKDKQYDNVLFYFSGHGETNYYQFKYQQDDGSIKEGFYGPFHLWIGNDHSPILQELDILCNVNDTKYKNVIIISDACQATRVYDFADLSDDTKKMVRYTHACQNDWQNRNLLTANATLAGRLATGWSNEECGLYALGLIQYLEQKNLPIIKMLEQVNKFVVEYSKREKGEILQQPNALYTQFDTNFCLYEPEE